MNKKPPFGLDTVGCLLVLWFVGGLTAFWLWAIDAMISRF